MRREYDTPEMEIIRFESLCVITTSGDGWSDDTLNNDGETEDW